MVKIDIVEIQIMVNYVNNFNISNKIICKNEYQKNVIY